MADLLGGGVDQDTVKSVLDYLGKGAITRGGPRAGYQKFANGLMIQWGKHVANSYNAKVITFTFPVPFAAAPIIASTTQALADTWGYVFSCEGYLTTTGFKYAAGGNNLTDGSSALYWIAIGAWK
jgi:hypothetical protein